MNKRLFVAIDPPEVINSQLSQLCCGLPDARWTDPSQFHLTLSFIGEVDGTVFQEVCEALDSVGGPSFSLSLKGVGVFPPRGMPKVLWAGVEKNQALTVLQRKITTRLFQLGLSPDTRKFFPHITLARLRNTPASKVGRYLQGQSLYASPEFTVKKFILYSSVLGRRGATHLTEVEYGLDG